MGQEIVTNNANSSAGAEKVYAITVIPGDGIGPEVVAATQKVLEATGLNFDWQIQLAGAHAYHHLGDPLPQQTLDSIRQNKVALKGPTHVAKGANYGSINVDLRKQFDLYANVRRSYAYTGVPARYPGVDLVVFRENVEDFYCGTERFVDEAETIAEATGVITMPGSERIFRAAFEYARKKGRKTVTAVHKANIFPKFYGTFLNAGRRVAEQYPEIEFNDRIVDNMAMQLVVNPHQFDVIVCTNLFGDIISDLCAGLVGGLGVAPGANIGDDCAIYEAVHGTAPDIAGKNIANPTALILSGAMMLSHLGEEQAARAVRKALIGVLAEGTHVTADIAVSTPVGTEQMASHIASRVRNLSMAAARA
ncbi:isocitrate/isopropylmalate dehydrogenase family protein [bacterium]|nr:MAG: isocitrate/isopropylmalate dehydrogenase family protein [bacterium]